MYTLIHMLKTDGGSWTNFEVHPFESLKSATDFILESFCIGHQGDMSLVETSECDNCDYGDDPQSDCDECELFSYQDGKYKCKICIENNTKCTCYDFNYRKSIKDVEFFKRALVSIEEFYKNDGSKFEYKFFTGPISAVTFSHYG